MSSEFKICIYLKGKEKPIILTDVVNKDNLHADVVERFQNLMSNKDQKVLTLDFNNDVLVILNSDIEGVKISKPEVNDVEMNIHAVEESEDISIITDEEPLEGENEDDEIFNNEDDDIEVVKE